jgi:hypothetical protein
MVEQLKEKNQKKLGLAMERRKINAQIKLVMLLGPW